MAEATNDLISEGLKAIQRDAAYLREAYARTGERLIALGGRLDTIQQDVHTLFTASARQDERLDCIERRLDLAAAH